MNKIFLKVASKTASNGFYKKNIFSDDNPKDNDFGKHFGGRERELNENELKFVNVRKQYEEKVFKEKILKEKERLKECANRKKQSETEKTKNLMNKEVLLFNESFNNISFIEQQDKNENFDFNEKLLDSPINLSVKIDFDGDGPEIKNLNKNFVKEKENHVGNSKKDNRDNNIIIEDSNDKQPLKNVSKIEGSTKISKNEISKANKDDDSNNINVKNNNENNENELEKSKSENNFICEEKKFCKTGTNFYPKIQSENVPELLKRIMEKNKKEASVKQRDCFNNIISVKNQNLNKNGKFILSMEQPKTQHSKVNQFLKKPTEEPREINLEVCLSDCYFWRKHEELWSNLENNKFKINSDFDNYFIPKNESEIVSSIFFKENGVLKDKITITDQTFNPKHEIKKWKEAYKIAIKRWHPDKLIPLLADLKIKDEVKNSYVLVKCGSIVQNINNSINTILETLKKVSNKQAPML